MKRIHHKVTKSDGEANSFNGLEEMSPRRFASLTMLNFVLLCERKCHLSSVIGH